MKTLERYSVGTGDRFGRQGRAQLSAFERLSGKGIGASIVWNKSNREHVTIGTTPADQRAAADAAVAALNFQGSYAVDADHIGLATVDKFIPYCDFFTIDVADFIGKKPDPAARARFVATHRALASGSGAPVRIGEEDIEKVAGTYLAAIEEARKVYERILSQKPDGDFIVEVSMDETDSPQSPAELAVILAGLAEAGIPLQTIAPKFSGRFNKGVDYVGNPSKFAEEFEADARVAGWAVKQFGLPETLKLSVHSGSDKFIIYPAIRDTMTKLGCGVHLKTAGTTWLEELIGLAEAGGDGLALAKLVYARAYGRYEELAAPYASVIDVSLGRLPAPSEVELWSSSRYVSTLRHDQRNPHFNPDFRQLLHIGYKVAAELGPEYLQALDTYEEHIGRNVADNLYLRHFVPLFLG